MTVIWIVTLLQPLLVSLPGIYSWNAGSSWLNLWAFAAVKNDGTVIAKGNSSYGANAPAGLSGVKMIVSSSQFGECGAFAALKDDNTVTAWGASNCGGSASSIQSSLVNVKSIHATYRAFAVLKTDGSVVAWGDAAFGGSTATPNDVTSALENVTSLYNNPHSFTALLKDKTVLSWGHQTYGGDSSDVASQLTNVVLIASTGTAMAALKSDGTVIAWGDSSKGGNTALVSAQLIGVTAIYSCARAFIALKNDSTVVVWGFPQDISGAENVTSIQFSQIFSCEHASVGLTADNKLYSWGASAYGGTGGSLVISGVKYVYSTHAAFAALMTDLTVHTFGNGGKGGNSAAVASELYSIRTIASNGCAFAAIRETDGKVITWGGTDYGAVGVVPNLAGVSMVSSLNKMFMAWKNDSSVLYWSNSNSYANLSNVARVYGTTYYRSVSEYPSQYLLEGLDIPFPTSQPTSEPTSTPSSQPTSEPTSTPSSQPTSTPSSQPSTTPTATPTTSVPTSAPSCNAGEVSSLPGSSACVPCEEGTYAHEAGGAQCDECAAGRFSPSQGQTACDVCEAGHFSQEGAATCTKCAKGRYASSSGTGGNCTLCEAGKFFSEEGASECMDCERGYYASSIGSTKCLESPAGSFLLSSAGAPQLCPAGKFSLPGDSVCTICPQDTFSGEEGSGECTACAPGRITPGLGANREAQCVSPEMNFITAGVVLVFVMALSWEYLFRGRYTIVAFLRKERVLKSLAHQAHAIPGYLFRYLYKGEAQRIYLTAYPVIRVALFFTSGTILTFISAVGAYFALLGRIVFKSMIIVVGLKMDVSFLPKLDSIREALVVALRIQFLNDFLFAPFVAMITFLAQFEISLDSINVTCTGSTAPIKLLGNLFVVGVVIVLIESEFALFKDVIYDSLVKKFGAVTLNVAYRRWTPAHFNRETNCVNSRKGNASKTLRLFSFHFLSVLFSTALMALFNGLDLFQNTLQFLASKIKVKDFASYRWVSHSWDANCNVTKGFPMADMGIALAASAVAWLLLCPALFILSSVLIPGLPPGVRPIAEQEQRSLGTLNWNQWYHKVWKYTSILAFDLWWAELAHHWMNFIRRSTPYDIGDRAPSVAQAASLVIDPLNVSKGEGTERDVDRVVDSDLAELTSMSKLSESSSTISLNVGTSAALAKLERPTTRHFRAVVSITPASGTMFRFFTCDRVINEDRVWVEVPLNQTHDQFLFHIDKGTGEILFQGSYPAWSRERPKVAEDIATDLFAAKEGTAIVFVRAGNSKSSQDVVNAMVEKSFFQMTGPEEFYSAFGANTYVYASPNAVSAAKLLVSGVSTSIDEQQKSCLDVVDEMSSPETRVLRDMARAIAWAGGDASKLPCTLSYILLGTPPHRKELTKLSRSYQQWHTEGGNVFERSLSEDVDISEKERAALGDNTLLYLEFTTPDSAGGGETENEDEKEARDRLQVLQNDFRGSENRGSREQCLCFRRNSFITSTLPPRTDAENAALKTRSSLGLPSYLHLCRMEYDELMGSPSSASCFKDFLYPIPFLFVALGMAHVMTEVGRRALYVVVWKYVRFLLLCFGYWTDDVCQMYHVHQKLETQSLIWTHPYFKDHSANHARPKSATHSTVAKGTSSWSHNGRETDIQASIPETTLKHMYSNDYSRALSTIVSTRACLLQLVPGLAILSIFANLTSIAPMLVYSEKLDLSLPEIVISNVDVAANNLESEFTRAVNKIRQQELHEDDYCVPVSHAEEGQSHASLEEQNDLSRKRMRTCLAQPELLVKQWAVSLRRVVLCASHSRGFTFVHELSQFCLILVLLFGLTSQKSFAIFIALSIVMLLPVCIIHAIGCYILVGKVLAITDDDLALFLRWFTREKQDSSQSTSSENFEGDVTLSDIYEVETNDAIPDGEISMSTNPMLRQR